MATKPIRDELLDLAGSFKEEGFSKLAERLTGHAGLFAKAEKTEDDKKIKVKADDEIPDVDEDEVEAVSDEDEDEEDADGEEDEDENEVKAEEDEDEDEVKAEGEEDEVEADEDEDEDEEDKVEAKGDEEEEDADEDEDEDEEDEVEAMEEMDEDIAMRDACTKIYRAARKAGNHPSPKVRALSKRLLKVERLIRATL